VAPSRREVNYAGDVGLLWSFLGDRTDCDRCKPALKDSVLKDFLTLVDLLAPYRDEKLSDGRWCRENIIPMFQVERSRLGIDWLRMLDGEARRILSASSWQ